MHPTKKIQLKIATKTSVSAHLTLQLTSSEERAFHFLSHATGRLKNTEKIPVTIVNQNPRGGS